MKWTSPCFIQVKYGGNTMFINAIARIESSKLIQALRACFFLMFPVCPSSRLPSLGGVATGSIVAAESLFLDA
ncbi:hypothetical protein IHQ56_12725 [Methylobacillus flagellatus]|uniref:hypothetical protein n=1 Tax=Methylobacillus flagellatus TaxID=405 RepID=UPI0028540234|nr:hypothetical protein [Methylobacillus flagellatus]MDR5172687.1 hypothetical protein [Methylobacillus flagellatus]